MQEPRSDMLLFFPTPYPDELLYSIAARYHRRSCNGSVKATVKDLFGSATACAVIDLPNRLERLSRQLPIGTCNSADKVINEHTLLPLYRPFLPQDRLIKIIHWMKGSNCGNRIHGAVGAMSSGIPLLSNLRWCPVCVDSDEQEFGEPFWHRAHQVMGVLVCQKHGVGLCENSELLVSERNKHYFHMVPKGAAQEQPAAIPDRSLPKFMQIARSISWLLTTHDIPVLDLQALRDQYLHYLKKADLATYSGRIAQTELAERFTAYYGADFLTLTHSLLPSDVSTTWLSSLVRKPRKVTHPLRHLLLIHFLGVDVADFFYRSTSTSHPFGAGPWPCLNPAASHYRKLVVSKCYLSRNTSNGKPVGNFYCSCGFNYARTGPDLEPKDRFRRGRIISFGPTWERELRRLIVQKKLSLRKAARLLGVDTNTVKAHLSPVFSEVNEPMVNPAGEELEVHRSKWLGLCAENPLLGRKALRILAPAEYAWLYRHDREWLSLHPDRPMAPKLNSATRTDWASRDRKLAQEVISAVNAIHREPGRPVRVTISAIGKKLGALALLQKKMAKLPLTRAVIDAVLETDDDYGIRRIREAVCTIQNRGGTLTPWKLVREARLRPGYSVRVEKEVEIRSSAFRYNKAYTEGF